MNSLPLIETDPLPGMQIADTPETIAAYTLLVLKGALKLETKGLQASRGLRASVVVRNVLAKAGKPAPRDKNALLATFETHLRAIGVLVTQPSPVSDFPLP